MIASGSNYRPHLGRVIRDLFRLLHAVRHGTEALVYSNHPRDVAASSFLAIIFGRIASGVPGSSTLNSSTNAAPASVQAFVALNNQQ